MHVPAVSGGELQAGSANGPLHGVSAPLTHPPRRTFCGISGPGSLRRRCHIPDGTVLRSVEAEAAIVSVTEAVNTRGGEADHVQAAVSRTGGIAAKTAMCVPGAMMAVRRIEDPAIDGTATTTDDVSTAETIVKPTVNQTTDAPTTTAVHVTAAKATGAAKAAGVSNGGEGAEPGHVASLRRGADKAQEGARVWKTTLKAT